MGQQGRREFSPEMKVEAVRVYLARVAQGVKLAHIARDLGVRIPLRSSSGSPRRPGRTANRR